MRFCFLLFLIVSNFCFTQDSCDSIYQNPEISAQFNSPIHAVRLMEKIVIILQEFIPDDEIISSLSINLAINSDGKIIAITIPKLHLNQLCIEKLNQIILQEAALIPASENKRNVCLNYIFNSFINLE